LLYAITGLSNQRTALLLELCVCATLLLLISCTVHQLLLLLLKFRQQLATFLSHATFY